MIFQGGGGPPCPPPSGPTHITCDFPGWRTPLSSPPPHPPSGSTLDFFHAAVVCLLFHAATPHPHRRQFLDPHIHVQFYNLTYNVYVHLPFSLELEWKRIRLLAYQSCWLSSKRRPYILRNAHFTTRMRISLNVSFFHGRRFLRYTGSCPRLF